MTDVKPLSEEERAITEGQNTDRHCPVCGCPLIENQIGMEWCTYVGDSMRRVPGCDYHRWNRERAIEIVQALERQLEMARDGGSEMWIKLEAMTERAEMAEQYAASLQQELLIANERIETLADAYLEARAEMQEKP